MTLLLSALIYVGFIAVHTAIAVAVIVLWVARHNGADPTEYSQGLYSDGLFVAVATLAAAPFCILTTLGAVRLRSGMGIRDYLGLRKTRMLQWIGWTVLTVAGLFAMDYIRLSLGEPLVPEIVVSWFATAGILPLLVLAIVVAAPVMEEVIFRGFMFRGLAASRVGVAGAIVLTALFWAALHAGQYNLLDTGMIFGFGLILGGARATSGSLYLPLFLHALNNGVSTFQIMYFVERGG